MMSASLIVAALALLQSLTGAAPLPDPARVQASVLQSCQLEPRQFTVEQVGSRLRVQRSPSLSQDQTRCVDYVLSQWKVPG